MPKAALKIWRQFGTNDRLLISAVLSLVNYRGRGQGLAMMIDFQKSSFRVPSPIVWHCFIEHLSYGVAIQSFKV
jgi:hypothetical protein